MRLDEYANYDALGLAELVRDKDIAPQEVCALATSAMCRCNEKLNFLVGDTEAFAKKSLEDLQADGPFAGVPTLIKDVGPRIAGVRQELGSGIAQGFTPTETSELARRFVRAGLIFIGRSATPELGLAYTTEPRAGGATRNPWDLERSPGGSSGGAAAAVAAGVVPIAQGGDTGGSIRVPAHCCGLFGLKPTRGRNPMGPESAEGNSGMTVAHVLTRTVRDSAAALDATAGPDPGARYFAPPPARPLLEEVTRPRKELRIALSTDNPFGGSVAPEIKQAAQDAARLCEKLGHHVEEATPPINAGELCEMLELISAGNLTYGVRGLEAQSGKKAGPDVFESFTLALLKRGQNLPAADFVANIARMNTFSRNFGQFFVKYDVLITPVFATTAPKLGTLRMNDPIPDLSAYIMDVLRTAAFTTQYNFSGQPAMSVPLYQSADGLPIGVQFAARYADEATLFSLAGQLEEALPWKGRYAPNSIFGAQS